MGTSPGGFNRKGDKLYGSYSIDRDKAAVVWWSPTISGASNPPVVFESEKADVSGSISNPDTYEPEAIAVNYLRPELTVIDNSDNIATDIENIEKE